MTPEQWIVAAVIVGILLFVVFVGVLVLATIEEAERKLGRDLSTGEVFFWVFAGTVVSGAGFVLLLYVWFFMPEPETKR